MTDTNTPANAGSRAAAGSATLTQEQRAILHHTLYRAAGGYYCGGGPDMDVLVSRGLMQSAGRKLFVPDEYFRITAAGRAALQSPNAAGSPTPSQGGSRGS